MLEGMTPKLVGSQRCKVNIVMSQLDDSDADLLKQYLASPDWSSNHLANSLRERGVLISVHTILKHRKGLCAC